MPNLYGLIGKKLNHSFSKDYFTTKFKQEGIIAEYHNFPLSDIIDFATLLDEKEGNLKGLNVTIPYKEEVFHFLDELDEHAKNIGAVNTIKIINKRLLKGYNTDYIGFKNSIEPLLKFHHTKALIFGTGGASKAIQYALDQLEIPFKQVSRSKDKAYYTYADLNEDVLKEYTVLINCTPIGTYPNIEELLPINFDYLTNKHLLYDLVYNPSISKFLQKGKDQGTSIKNGLEMLEIQAEESWKRWNE